MSFQRILVPVDYSDNSRLAVLCAVNLAQRFGATLDIVHAWDRPAYAADTLIVERPGASHKPLGELIRENAQKDMEEFLKGIEGLNAVQSERRLISGEPAAALLKELEQKHHDLVVVGTHGRTGISHLLLGSVAERLVRLSPAPVLTVPGRSASRV